MINDYLGIGILVIIAFVFGWFSGFRRCHKSITDELLNYWKNEGKPKWHKIFRIVNGEKP